MHYRPECLLNLNVCLCLYTCLHVISWHMVAILSWWLSWRKFQSYGVKAKILPHQAQRTRMHTHAKQYRFVFLVPSSRTQSCPFFSLLKRLTTWWKMFFSLTSWKLFCIKSFISFFQTTHLALFVSLSLFLTLKYTQTHVHTLTHTHTEALVCGLAKCYLSTHMAAITFCVFSSGQKNWRKARQFDCWIALAWISIHSVLFFDFCYPLWLHVFMSAYPFVILRVVEGVLLKSNYVFSHIGSLCHNDHHDVPITLYKPKTLPQFKHDIIMKKHWLYRHHETFARPWDDGWLISWGFHQPPGFSQQMSSSYHLYSFLRNVLSHFFHFSTVLILLALKTYHHCMVLAPGSAFFCL